jgi:hypothetical protein
MPANKGITVDFGTGIYNYRMKCQNDDYHQ